MINHLALEIIGIFDIDYLESIVIYRKLDAGLYPQKYLLRIWVVDEFLDFCFVCGGEIGEIGNTERELYEIDPWHRHQKCHPKFLTKEEVINCLLDIGLSQREVDLIEWE